jgi:hypothetical protein
MIMHDFRRNTVDLKAFTKASGIFCFLEALYYSGFLATTGIQPWIAVR